MCESEPDHEDHKQHCSLLLEVRARAYITRLQLWIHSFPSSFTPSLPHPSPLSLLSLPSMESPKDDYDAMLDDDPGESFVPQLEVLESTDKKVLLLQPRPIDLACKQKA